MKILSIDTSCDETAVAVSDGVTILSNIIWSQASLHAKFGGVFPSLAKREHEKRIDWVIKKALTQSICNISEINAAAVTAGPGLAIALEVGIKKAKEISLEYKIPLIAVNHIEGHILSCLAKPKTNHKSIPSKQNENISFPAIGIVTSGGHTQVIFIKEIGTYKILASTIDDALGEALDKAARMLGLGYPGGPLLEKLAKEGESSKYSLPVPLIGQEKRMELSYSGLKTAFYRLIEEVRKNNRDLNKQQICDLCAVFQKTAFMHFIRVFEWMIKNGKIDNCKDILAGGGVMANLTLRKMLRRLAVKHNLKIHFPYTKTLYGDNAAMIGTAASFKAQRNEYVMNSDKIDRAPNAKIDQPFNWQYNS